MKDNKKELGIICESCWYKRLTDCGAKKYKNKKKCHLWRDDTIELKSRLSWGDDRDKRRGNRGSSYYGQS